MIIFMNEGNERIMILWKDKVYFWEGEGRKGGMEKCGRKIVKKILGE